MDRNRPETGWRPAALAAALFAITLNFLQPLAHAALLRDGAPQALWTIFCSAAVGQQDDGQGTLPATAQKHECCMGLAHAQLGAEPPTAFSVVEPSLVAVLSLQPSDQLTPVGARDGPHQPRGPPYSIDA